MKRRKFLVDSVGLAAGSLVANEAVSALARLDPNSSIKVDSPASSEVLSDGQQSKYSHRLPKTDQNYLRSTSYVEDDPLPEYRWAPDEAYEAFQDMKYGIRVHWGLYSIWNIDDTSWPFLGNRIPAFDFARRQEYQQLYKTWNPAGFDAEEWMKAFKEFGAKMFAFTTKHHEGFSMYDTKTKVKQRPNWTAPGGPCIEACDTSYSIMDTPFERDVVKELCDAAHRHGIKIDLYFSHSDWYDADFRPYGYHPLQVPSSPVYCQAKSPLENETEFERAKQRQKDFLTIVPDPTPEEEQRMIQRHRAQLKELLTNYGTIDMMCLDIWLGPRVWPQLRQTIMELRKIQPNVMFRARGIGNYGDYYTPERFVPEGKENTDAPWFVIDPLGTAWAYDDNPENYKGAKWVVSNLVDAVSKGGNFMVGIGPDVDGRFSPAAVKQLQEVGAWLKINGEGIYATRARAGELWKEGGNIRFARTKDNATVYAHCLEWPGDMLTLKSVRPKDGTKIHLLGHAEALPWKVNAEGELVIVTQRKILDALSEAAKLAFTFRIEVA
jgi:alpha-L-fucosidase